MDDREPLVQINSSAVPVAGIGGLGMVGLAVVIAIVFPQARFLVLCGLAGGVLFAAALVVVRRRRPRSKAGTSLSGRP